jgi:hypothetical protein
LVRRRNFPLLDPAPSPNLAVSPSLSACCPCFSGGVSLVLMGRRRRTRAAAEVGRRSRAFGVTQCSRVLPDQPRPQPLRRRIPPTKTRRAVGATSFGRSGSRTSSLAPARHGIVQRPRGRAAAVPGHGHARGTCWRGCGRRGGWHGSTGSACARRLGRESGTDRGMPLLSCSTSSSTLLLVQPVGRVRDAHSHVCV